MLYVVEMDEFNFENASRFLDECAEKEKRGESARQVITRLKPKIRQMMGKGYTQREIYDLLVEEFRLEISFSTFRSYLVPEKAKNGKQD